jgi:hypothetical protein
VLKNDETAERAEKTGEYSIAPESSTDPDISAPSPRPPGRHGTKHLTLMECFVILSSVFDNREGSRAAD